MTRESKWIEFEHFPPKPGYKTSIWIVKAKQSGATLGLIKWFPAWREYCFWPVDQTVYAISCLRDLADFIEEKNKEPRE